MAKVVKHQGIPHLKVWCIIASLVLFLLQAKLLTGNAQALIKLSVHSLSLSLSLFFFFMEDVFPLKKTMCCRRLVVMFYMASKKNLEQAKIYFMGDILVYVLFTFWCALKGILSDKKSCTAIPYGRTTSLKSLLQTIDLHREVFKVLNYEASRYRTYVVI